MNKLMSQLKARLLSFYTQRLIRKRSIASTNVGFDQAQTIGILYHRDDSSKQKAIEQLASNLKHLGKEVSILCYISNPEKDALFTDPVITLREIQLFGKIANPQAQTFVDTPFDYLYQVDLVGHPVIDYLLAKSQAKCRVGNYTANRAGLFEMMVSLANKHEGAAVTDLAAQMLHYTQLLKTA